MLKRLFHVFLACSVSLGFPSTLFAGAWTQDQGGYYLKVAGSYLNSTDDIDAMGNRIQKARMGELTDYNYSAYLEYGVLDRLTIVSSLPYRRLSDTRIFENGTALEKRSGFGDLEARFRWLVAPQPVVVSIAAGGKVPFWYDESQGTRVPLSSRKLDGDVRLLIGRSLYPFPGYVTGEVGYRVRGGDFSNEMFYFLEAGFTLNRFLIKGFAGGIRTSGKCVITDEVGLIGDQNVFKISPGVIYRLSPRLELSLDLIHIAAGCNTTAGQTVLFGVAIKR